ncbi:MAG: hypothetical protein KA371_04160 [Acidobacteria bacterium]|nr:hypothetical protein [Acidobacteriota bacterium]
MTSRNRCWIAVATFVISAGVVRETAAQEGWASAPMMLSSIAATGGTIYSPRVDVNAAGNGVALWTEPGPTVLGVGPIVRTARYDAATRRWSDPHTLSGATRSAIAIDVVGDGSGNALAIWRINPISVNIYLQAARYDGVTGLWSDVALGAGAFLDHAAVAMSDDGDAVVCWADNLAGTWCRRYSATTATWAPAESLGVSASGLDVARDAAGNIHVVWASGTAVQAARFDATTSTWGAAADLATGLPGAGQSMPQVATNDAGDAVATWTRGSMLEASRFPAGGGGWSAASTLSSSGTSNAAARIAIDTAGHATVVWLQTQTTRRMLVARWDSMAAAWTAAAGLPGQAGGFAYPGAIDVDPGGNVHVVWSQSLASPGLRLLASRYAASTGEWTTVSNLSALDQFAYNPDVAVDSTGSAVSVWFQSISGFSATASLRWAPTPAAPATTGVTPTSGALSVAFAMPATVDPALTVTNLDYSLDGGATWTMRSPSAGTSPLAIAGLVDGVTYRLRLRAVNAAGAGTPTPSLPVRSGTSLDPADLRVVSRAGNVVTFAWVAPVAGLVPTGYVLEGGVSTQQILASIPTGGAATQLTLSVPNGVFYVRIVAVHGALRLGATPFLQLAVNAGTSPVGAHNLLGSTSGDTLALSWSNDWSVATLTGLRLYVAGVVTTSVDLPVVESFTFSGVPPGTYGFSVAPLGGANPGAATGVRMLSFPGTCTSAPNPPVAFSASTQGSVVFLDWLPPATGEAVTHYLVSASGAFNGTFPMTGRTFAAPVPPGSYTIAVAAVGPCGTSTQATPQTVVVP